jgi:hypothetical protein
MRKSKKDSVKRKEIDAIFLLIKDDEDKCNEVLEYVYCRNNFEIHGIKFEYVNSNDEGHPAAVYKLPDGTHIMWLSLTTNSWNTEEFSTEPETWLDYYIVTPAQKTIDIWVDSDGNRVGENDHY